MRRARLAARSTILIPRLREKAADALARLRTPAAQDVLGRALNKVLAERAGPPKPNEHELSQNLWLEHLAEAMAAFGPGAAPQLIAILQNCEIELRNRSYVLYGAGAARAAEHLGKMFYAGAASSLIDRLRDPIQSVRWSAARALGAVRATTAIEPLISVLRDHDELVREHASEALGAIGDVRAVTALEEKLKDGSASVRRAAVAALERLGWKPQSRDHHASVSAAMGEYAETAKQGASALRPLMAAIWSAYWIKNAQSNDAQGMANQLKNLMKKRELMQLPVMSHIQGIADALLVVMTGADKSFERKDLVMLAVMPDLRVRHFGQRTHWSDDSGTYERWEDFEAVVSCEALREHAAELMATIG